MHAKYLGPSDIFAIGGKEYQRGDMIPNISAEVLRHHMSGQNGGHRFEVDIADAGGVTQPATLAEADTERGEVPASVTNASGSTPVVGAPAGDAAPTDKPKDKKS